MSIESVKARMSEVAARRREVVKKPETIFKNILEEKLGIVSSAENTVSTAAAADGADVFLSSANLQNTALGLQTPVSGTQSTESAASTVYSEIARQS